MKVLVVVEDDPDVQLLIEAVFSMDSRFSLPSLATAAEDALELARTTEPGLIVLDHRLSGKLTGLTAAPRFKAVAPNAKIILFTAHSELRDRAGREPAVDAFVLKTDAARLLAVAQRLTGLAPVAG